ncbi:MAG: nucleotidyl transferase AbiEii/AbiGii toxin family protein [Candidatus Omnitrophica bacterium]|nr:nucleotidyl transferase AbiEii/AbiGii toxin family protein [Candidatus Omnitrophota bacterium]
MIDARQVRELADRYQTPADNIVREYFQHLFLSHLYRQKNADHLLFKGGTALRVVWQSPRFSEDLDFTCLAGRQAGTNASIHAIESVLEKTLVGVEAEGIHVKIDEAKKTSGGYFSILQFEGEGNRGEIQLEVSLRAPGKPKGDTALIPSEFLPAFTLIRLEEKILVHEKVAALLTRAKPRDFYDLYFILRSRLAFKEVFQKDKSLKAKLLEAMNKTKLDAKSELKRFLPASQHGLLKNFKAILTAEIERTLP